MLEAVIRGGQSVEFNEDGAAEHIPRWSTWKNYIAKHARGEDIVGGHGIVRVTAEFVAGTRDANRGGQQRCDFVFYVADGGFWRLHPGRVRAQDAAPVYVGPDTFCPQVLQSTAPIAFTADTLWEPDRMQLPFTEAQAVNVPQTDRMGRKQVWAWITSLGAGEHNLDVTFGQHGFKWWLWVATMERSSGAVVGTGIDSARVWTNGTGWAEFSFGRCDGSTYKAALTLRSNGEVVLKSTP